MKLKNSHRKQIKTPNRVKSNLIRNRVHKTLILDSGSDGLQAITFNSASKNELSQSHYNALNGLFYRHNFPVSRSCGGQPCEYGTLYRSAHFLEPPQYRHKFNDEGVVYDIPKKYYGERIVPGSFILNEITTGSITIKDDFYGNLYASNASIYNDITGGNFSSSISSSENYIGNIFYEVGIVVLTETESFSSGCKYTALGTDYTLQLDSDVVIHTMEYEFVLKKNEWNTTSNKTVLERPVIVKGPYGGGFNNGKLLMSQSFEAIGSVSDSKIDPKYIDGPFGSGSFSTYITSIGLFNSYGDLLMTATLPTPLRKSKKRDLLIKVQMDF